MAGLKESWVNPKLEVRPSPIGGRGIFAREPIAKGEVVVRQGGRITDLGEFYEMVPRRWWYKCFQIGEQRYICPVDEASVVGAYLMNHSCDPNVWLDDALTFAAMRDIKPGEELCYDYAMTDKGQYRPMTCHCGSQMCRSVVKHNDWKIKKLQERYKNHFSPYINELIISVKQK